MTVGQHTQGEARVGTDDEDCVLFIGYRQIGECYEDGEPQNDEDRANAAEIVKRWNAYPKMVEALKNVTFGREDLQVEAYNLLRELRETL